MKDNVEDLLVESKLSDEDDIERMDKVSKKFEDVKNMNMKGIKIFEDGVIEFKEKSEELIGNYKN